MGIFTGNSGKTMTPPYATETDAQKRKREKKNNPNGDNNAALDATVNGQTQEQAAAVIPPSAGGSGFGGFNDSGQGQYVNDPTKAPEQGRTADVNTTVARPAETVQTDTNQPGQGDMQRNINPTLTDAVTMSGLKPEQLNIDPALFRAASPQEQLDMYNKALAEYNAVR